MLDLSKVPDKAPDFNLEELFEAGMHFGHPRRKWHPKMAPYIYMEKNGMHIFDLEKTAEQLKIAYNLVYHLASEGKKVIIVGTKRQAKEIVERSAEEAGMLYITSRWLGGLLTNWPQVSKSLKRMIEIEKKLEEDGYKGYTKYEVVQIEKELSRLRRFFSGIRGLKDTPDCIIVIDPVKEINVVKEAKVVGVPMVALIDSNGDPTQVDVAVPANDDASKSIEYFVKTLATAYAKGKKTKGEAKPNPVKGAK